MRSCTPFGSARRMSSTRLRMPAATVTVSAPNCLMMRALTTSPFSRCAMPRRTAGASRTSATSPSSTGTSPRIVDDGAAQVVDRLRAARAPARSTRSAPCATMPPEAFTFDSSTACMHLVEADAPRRHALRIELHLELAQIAAEPLHRRDAGHGEQPVVDLELGEIAQRHQIRGAGIGFERELEDLVQPAGEARDERRVGARRKLARSLRDALGDELSRAVVVGVGLELDRDLRDAELRRSSGRGARPAARRARLRAEWRWRSRAPRRPSPRSA